MQFATYLARPVQILGFEENEALVSFDDGSEEYVAIEALENIENIWIMDEKTKILLERVLGILNAFDYDPATDDDCPKDTFSGEVNLDWFFHIKNDLEKTVNNQK